MIEVVGQAERSGTAAAGQLCAEGSCASALHAAQTGSTNSLALQELSGSQITAAMMPRLIVADEQTHGRGRLGRTWRSHGGTLTFSLVVPLKASPDRIGLVSLAAGIGIARAIEHTFAPLRVNLKWPNDVYLGDGKVAGVLCETAASAIQSVVIGIGLNVDGVPDLSDQPDAPRVVSLAQVVGRPLARYDLLGDCVTHVIEALRDVHHDQAAAVQEFRGRCILAGRQVRCRLVGETVHGRCLGVTPDGHLAIETDRGIRTCTSGEVTLTRPRK